MLGTKYDSEQQLSSVVALFVTKKQNSSFRVSFPLLARSTSSLTLLRSFLPHPSPLPPCPPAPLIHPPMMWPAGSCGQAQTPPRGGERSGGRSRHAGPRWGVLSWRRPITTASVLPLRPCRSDGPSAPLILRGFRLAVATTHHLALRRLLHASKLLLILATTHPNSTGPHRSRSRINTNPV